jgi:DNA invertase Pin-like site-specific DNA recombinase
MSGQIAGYVRVSSAEQNPDRQVVAIGEVDETFTDKVSGKSRAGRPALGEMLRYVRRGDTVRVASMDRLARSVVDLAQLVQDMTSRGVRVEFVTERLTFDPGAEDPFATFQLHLLGAVAQLERSLIRERQREGIEIAKAKGVYRGRARKLGPDQAATARQMVDGGVPKAKVARDLGCSRRVLYDLLAGRGAYAEPTSADNRSITPGATRS